MKSLVFLEATKIKSLITHSVDIDELEIKESTLLVEEFENKETNKLILDELDKMNEDFKEVFV